MNKIPLPKAFGFGLVYGFCLGLFFVCFCLGGGLLLCFACLFCLFVFCLCCFYFVLFLFGFFFGGAGWGGGGGGGDN